MKPETLAKTGKSILRITAALAVIFGIPAVGYLLWRPGSSGPLPEFRNNAVWIGHGWLGDDGWFGRNKRGKDAFRNRKSIAALFEKLAANRITTVYPHLCPAQFDGRIAPYDGAQTERLLDAADRHGMKVVPWTGGILYESARPGDRKWKKNFIASMEELFKKHPRIAGIQINIEPMPDGNAEFLQFLDEVRTAAGKRILSVAAYPPPTKWHRYPNVHWSADYLGQVAERCDQMAVMMYDTAIPLGKFYTALMTDWTKVLADVVPPKNCELILGVPAYDDAGVGYHYPSAENITSALRGIAAAGRSGKLSGIALYCE